MQRWKDGVWGKKANGLKRKTSQDGGDIREEYLMKVCILTVESQGLASRERERENTVSMRGRKSVGRVQGDRVPGNIMTEVKKEGRPVEFLLLP